MLSETNESVASLGAVVAASKQMEQDAVFLLNIVGIFVAFGLVTRLYIWPNVRRLPTPDALTILILPHTFRVIGLGFLIDGVVSPELPSKLAIPNAWGDFGAAVLALAAIAAIQTRRTFALTLVWIFNVWGSIDLLYAIINGVALEVEPGWFGAYYVVPTVVVPALLVLHGLIFWLLIRARSPSGASRRDALE